MNSLKILMILTSQATMGAGGAPTGVWFEELATPYYAFVDAGAKVEIASIAGGRIPIDPNSRQAAGTNPASVERFLQDPAAMAKIEQARPVEGIDTAGYAAVFLPGGHGTMWDLPDSAALAALLATAWRQDKVVAAVCHGPAGLVNVRDDAGQPLVAGRRVSAFSNAEEAAVGLTGTVPFALESRLRELGARYESVPDFQPYAIRDGRLVTGQNPASSEEVARLTLAAIREAADRAR
ncbi:MAG TPA: type 1 glutamine amidotransferase domain-containing protein [Azonexus sp.]